MKIGFKNLKIGQTIQVENATLEVVAMAWKRKEAIKRLEALQEIISEHFFLSIFANNKRDVSLKMI